MFFKLIDKFFDEIKKILSIVSFVLIALSVLLFVYWFLFAFKFSFPQWLNSFVWGVIDVFSWWYKPNKQHNEIIGILPVLCSIVCGVLAYIVNCTIVAMENNHKKFRESVTNYRKNLENKINTQLHNSFLDELKANSLMLVKIRINVESKVSYLTNPNASAVDTQKFGVEIEKEILSSIDNPNIKTKGSDDGSIYLVLTNLEQSKDFLAELVENSADIIKKYISRTVSINFLCCAEIFNDMSEFAQKSAYLDKILSLKIPNKIAITPKFKIYYENLYPSFYYFRVLGEYNLNSNPDNTKNTTLFTLQRK